MMLKKKVNLSYDVFYFSVPGAFLNILFLCWSEKSHPNTTPNTAF